MVVLKGAFATAGFFHLDGVVTAKAGGTKLAGRTIHYRQHPLQA